MKKIDVELCLSPKWVTYDSERSKDQKRQSSGTKWAEVLKLITKRVKRPIKDKGQK